MAVTIRTPPAPPRSSEPGVRVRPWTRKEFYRAGELGLFGPEERLELLDGEILQKMTQNPPHAVALGRAFRHIVAAFGSGYYVRQQQPLSLTEVSAPEPDVLVVVGEDVDYLGRHPEPPEVRLLIEVSDTTLRFDRGRKRRAYARAGIPEYWILNLVDRRLEVYRSPAGARYRDSHVYAENDAVFPLEAPNAAIRIGDLLPPLLAST